MSEPTLYQRCAHYGNMAMQTLHECDGYVPVEPDYEAAWSEWKRTGNIEDAVDAALGIGGEDE